MHLVKGFSIYEFQSVWGNLFDPLNPSFLGSPLLMHNFGLDPLHFSAILNFAPPTGTFLNAIDLKLEGV